VRRKTSRTRLRRFLTATGQWCKVNAMYPSGRSGRSSGQSRATISTMASPATGTPCRSLRAVVRPGRQWLNRRSQRARMHWRTFTALLRRYPSRACPVARALRCRARRAVLKSPVREIRTRSVGAPGNPALYPTSSLLYGVIRTAYPSSVLVRRPPGSSADGQRAGDGTEPAGSSSMSSPWTARCVRISP